MSSLEYRRRKKKRPITEHECMIKFYEPIANKQRIMNKWLKKPER
jgi:hypothetical protein